nr:cobaltochelatase subunit CobN [Nocardioides alcanivorans]
MGGERRRGDAARLGQPDRHPRVRRPHHHCPLLLQGDRHGRAPRYVADPERCRRVAAIAVNHARLGHVPNAEKKVAVVLSAYPTKHSRIGNAVGLDTPVSTIRLLRRLRDAGYDLGAPGAIPGLDLDDDTEAGDALIHSMIAAGGQDEEWLTSGQLTDAHTRISSEQYQRWTAHLPKRCVTTWSRLGARPRARSSSTTPARSCSPPWSRATWC